MLRFRYGRRPLTRLARIAAAVLLCALAVAQESGVPVVIDGQEILRVYGSVGSFSAGDRAPEIERRIIGLARKGFAGEVETRAIPSEQATALLAGPIIIMAVTQKDAESAGVPQDQLARRYAAAVRDAISRYQVRHTWLNLLTAATKALIAWCLFCLSVWGFRRGIQWLDGRMAQRLSPQAPNAGHTGFTRLLLERGRTVLTTALTVIVWFAVLSEFSLVISYSLSLFPQTAGISTTLWDYLRQTFGSAGAAVLEYLPNGGIVIITIAVTHYLLRVLKFLADATERGDLVLSGMHSEMAKPTYQLARIIVVLFALIVVFPYLPGGKSEAFKGVSIFVGLLISLGSSSSVSNVLAGLVLTYMRPFHVGDRVKIADAVGDVLERTLLVTRLRTIKNVEIVIPNSAILGNQILNYSALARTRGLILNTTVTIGYDAPWRTVHDLLVSAALDTDGILHVPAPFVLETSLNDFHISYELNAYTDRANEIQNTYSHLHESIQDSFNKAGVEIMSPTFYALRDGNTVTIPEGHLPAGYVAPSFRIKAVEDRARGVPR